MATGNKKQVAEVMVIACNRFFCWFCKRGKFGLFTEEVEMREETTGGIDRILGSTFRETRRAITRLNADKIPAQTGTIIPIIPSACSVCISSSLMSVLLFDGSLLLS